MGHATRSDCLARPGLSKLLFRHFFYEFLTKFWRNDELDKKEIKEWNTIRSLIGKAGFQIET